MFYFYAFREIGMFDFTGEQKIIDSGVRNIYTPYQPITTNSLFFGRKKEIGNIVQQLEFYAKSHHED